MRINCNISLANPMSLQLAKPMVVLVCSLLLSCCFSAQAAERRLTSPNGKLAITISDNQDSQGLKYRVMVDGKQVIVSSRLGLEFKDGTILGKTSAIVATSREQRNSMWENRFGKRRIVSDNWKQLKLTLRESDAKRATFGLIVRAYNDGVAFRYDLPEASGLGKFILNKELTEFRFAENYRCWAGGESSSSETQYRDAKISDIPATSKSERPYRSVLPLLVETPHCYVAVAESDLMNWGGMFVSGTGTSAVTSTLATRSDNNGLVSATVPCVSPWRVLMIGRKAGDLIGSDLIANLATPNQLGDVSWVKPGICAWDSWWTGLNPQLPQFRGLDARGDTVSHKQYIDFAAEMGWSYQLIDWFWYKDDPTLPLPHVDMPQLFDYAKSRNVRLFVWMHSKDLKRIGFEKAFSKMAAWGAAGVKVDFMDSDSQETVQWYIDALTAAAKYKLLVDFHGAYKPTGLARTYPNFITQEGVLGNEYNKLRGNLCTPLHTATLPFTRGLLGPMDFTPGGFLNRTPQEFKIASPAEVMGTRSRQLAMSVIYESPLLVMCDSPNNYRDQPGIEFFRNLPTVWDETVVLEGEIGKSVVVARRAGEHWYLAGMNGDKETDLKIPLKFLGKGKWSSRSFSDVVNAAPTQLNENTTTVDGSTKLNIAFAPAGGFATVLRRIR